MPHELMIIPLSPAGEQDRASRRRLRRWLPLLICLGFPVLSRGDTLVDWLTFSATANRTHFSLLTDAGQARAAGQLDLTAGTLAPLSPAAGLLQASFWSPAPPFADSVSGAASVTTTKVQVAPQAGAVQYRLTIQAVDLSGLVFAVGQLFGVGAAGTREVDIVARTQAAVTVPVDFLGLNAWDNGLKFYTQPLDWDGGKVMLNPALDGESAFAFFRIPAGAVPVTELVFDVPHGYAAGSGDALEFAFGIPAPEPGVAAMLLLGIAGMSLSRHRRTRTF